MTNTFITKIRTNDDKVGIQKKRYRFVKARTTKQLLDKVNTASRWGWSLDRVWSFPARATLVKNEVITENGERLETVFQRRYDAETKDVVNVYDRYATKWTFTNKKMVEITNMMASRGYNVSFTLNTLVGFRTVFSKTYLKDMSEDLA